MSTPFPAPPAGAQVFTDTTTGFEQFQAPPMVEADWMKHAVKHPGAFTKKADAAGMTVAQFAAHVLAPANKDKYSTQTKRQASFAKAAHSVAKSHK